MSKTITQREMRNDSGAILRAAEGGEDFTVTRNGTPVARIVPLAEPDRRFVSTEELLKSAAGLPRVDHRRFRADLQDALDYEPRDPYERRND
ncbi:type II toxin-antitoxin system Phd/YefM family antitoxin [Glycomyces buryatensis]|uniref:Antitoxin n=1 Tax=Glycomyces buryatensis TaxID=2570927 RepID=A0A4S8QNR5_9ACTN|nr:type II toxin-antitoxin system prevent-host-death family antitoxin [Glycomyces buryatensis]THV42354.1 type II toxin-antitoxin system Phd/YefM family antitoxin [Glycomyces buryatensis]